MPTGHDALRALRATEAVAADARHTRGWSFTYFAELDHSFE